jgi:hypothetical protein
MLQSTLQKRALLRNPDKSSWKTVQTGEFHTLLQATEAGLDGVQS